MHELLDGECPCGDIPMRASGEFIRLVPCNCRSQDRLDDVLGDDFFDDVAHRHLVALEKFGRGVQLVFS